MESSSSAPDSESVVISSRHHERIDACSLVLSAKNISHHIRQDSDGTIAIICAAQSAERARYQVNRYLEENRNWPTSPAHSPASLVSGAAADTCPDRGSGLFLHGYRSLEARLPMV